MQFKKKKINVYIDIYTHIYMYIYIYITELLCHTLDTNTKNQLYLNCFLKLGNNKKKKKQEDTPQQAFMPFFGQRNRKFLLGASSPKITAGSDRAGILTQF